MEQQTHPNRYNFELLFCNSLLIAIVLTLVRFVWKFTIAWMNGTMGFWIACAYILGTVWILQVPFLLLLIRRDTILDESD